MNSSKGQLCHSSGLAEQIQESVSKHVRIRPIEQGTMHYCPGPEDVLDIFVEAISKYPPTILQLPISTVLLKIINEEHDEPRKRKRAIRRMNRIIKSALNEGDVVVRYGRQKFAMLLFNADETQAGKLCQRVKEAIHRYCYLSLKLKHHLTLEFAVSQHQGFNVNDFAELVFGNERNIRLARTLGDGAVVTRTDANENFQNHKNFLFHLGELHESEFYEADD